MPCVMPGNAVTAKPIRISAGLMNGKDVVLRRFTCYIPITLKSTTRLERGTNKKQSRQFRVTRSLRYLIDPSVNIGLTYRPHSITAAVHWRREKADPEHERPPMTPTERDSTSGKLVRAPLSGLRATRKLGRASQLDGKTPGRRMRTRRA